MLNAVNDDYLVFLDDLVDDPVVPTSSRVESLQFACEGLAQLVGVLSDGPKDGRNSGVTNLVRKPVEVSQAFRCDLDVVHAVMSHMVLQRHGLTACRLGP